MEKVNGRLTAGVFPWGSALREADIEGVSADALGWPKKHPGKVEDLRTVLGESLSTSDLMGEGRGQGWFEN